MIYPYSKIYQKQHTHTTLIIQTSVVTLISQKIVETNVVVWGENMIKYAQNVTLNSCSHVFTHKCMKVKKKTFQSSLNHHGARY